MLSTDVLVTYRTPDDGGYHAGVRREDGTIIRPAILEGLAGLLAVLQRWHDVEDALSAWDGDGHQVRGARLTAPVRYPRKILCAGANYRDHLAEMGAPHVAEGWEPWFFQKPPSTTVIGPGETILLPPDPEANVDWEAELAVVIGAKCRDVTPERAPDVVAGFTALNDISARGPHRRTVSLAPPFDYDWLASKGQDTFCPMGPGILPHWSVSDPHDLRIRLWRNGELQQDQSTAAMIFDCWQQISAASRLVTLEPGDVIATGTPAGVGVTRGLFLAPGDELTVEIERIGRLTNPVATRS